MAVIGTGGAVSKSSSSSSKKQKRAGQYGTPQTDIAAANKKAAEATNNGTINQTTSKISEPNWQNVDTGAPYWLNTQYDMGSQIGGGVTGVTGSDPANDYYSDLLAQQEKAVQERKKAALDANNAYIPQIDAYADQRLKDAYISKEMNRVNLPQELSAKGYSGGATETSLLGSLANYENTRNSIEKDRNEALTGVRQNAAQIEASGNAELADVASSYYQNLINKSMQDQATYKSDFMNTIGAYSDDYMAKINDLRANGYSDDSFEIRALMAARNKKITDQESSKASAEQQAFENYLKQTQLLYNVNKPYFAPKSSGGGGMSETEIISMFNSGLIDEATAKRLLGI